MNLIKDYFYYTWYSIIFNTQQYDGHNSYLSYFFIVNCIFIFLIFRLNRKKCFDNTFLRILSMLFISFFLLGCLGLLTRDYSFAYDKNMSLESQTKWGGLVWENIIGISVLYSLISLVLYRKFITSFLYLKPELHDDFFQKTAFNWIEYKKFLGLGIEITIFLASMIVANKQNTERTLTYNDEWMYTIILILLSFQLSFSLEYIKYKNKFPFTRQDYEALEFYSKDNRLNLASIDKRSKRKWIIYGVDFDYKTKLVLYFRKKLLIKKKISNSNLPVKMKVNQRKIRRIIKRNLDLPKIIDLIGFPNSEIVKVKSKINYKYAQWNNNFFNYFIRFNNNEVIKIQKVFKYRRNRIYKDLLIR